MYLENVVTDAVDPAVLGRFWERLLGAETLTDEPEGFETRLSVEGGPTLDLCFPRVPERARADPRLHLDLAGGPDQGGQAGVVERALALGATPLDIGQGDPARDLAWVVLADPEGNPFCVMDDRPQDAGSGPIAAVPVDSADPDRDHAFWAALTGWSTPHDAPHSLRHPSGRGPRVELWREPAPKPPGPAGKNRLHLDLRLEVDDDPDVVLARVRDLGGAELDPGWGDLPWRVLHDPSGNEWCLLPARA